jgi:hypothetical protein
MALTAKQKEIMAFLNSEKSNDCDGWVHRSDMPYCQNRVIDALAKQGLIERGQFGSGEYRAN